MLSEQDIIDITTATKSAEPGRDGYILPVTFARAIEAAVIDRCAKVCEEVEGSPCPKFWEWLPRAYRFDGVGNFTKYNMEVAFLAGKQHAPDDTTLLRQALEALEYVKPALAAAWYNKSELFKAEYTIAALHERLGEPKKDSK